jgi:tetratricopeptide (TPR) repeat protein
MNEPGNTTQLLVDRLMITHQENAARHREQVIEEACAAHPDAADALRARFRILQEAGMLGPLDVPGSSTSWSAKDRATISDPDAAKKYDPVGPYQPLRELGRGGQAVVYLAEDLRLNRPVALKVLKGLGALSETTMRRFRREAEVASRLDHPGICMVYDAGVRDGVPFIAMRYVAGESLAKHIARTRKQRSSEKQIRLEGEENNTPCTSSRDTTTRILQVIEKAARALHVAHEAGIIHRDVKPGNILVTPAGEPVLVDFGLAGDEDGGGITLTATGEMPGTPAYMSPEQLAFERIRVDRRTDVYSLGVTLFECLTLEPPFGAATREAMVQAIQHRSPADVRKLNPALPADLKVVLETALEKDRDRRYQSALDLAEDLRRVREREPIAAKPVGVVGRMLRYARRRPARVAVILLLVAGLPIVTGMVGYIVAHQPEIARQKEQAHIDAVERHLMAGYDELSTEGFGETGLGDSQRAMAAFEAALALQSGCAEAVAGKALVLLSQRKAETCLDFLDTHQSLEENVPALRGIRIDALRDLGKKEEAADLEAGIPPPETALEHFLEGSRLLQFRVGIDNPCDVRQALDHLTRATLASPHARLLYHGKLAHAVGRLAEATLARRVANALTTLWPERPEAWFWAGSALEFVDREESLSAIRQVVLLKPDSYFAHKNLGYHLADAGLFDEAIAAHQKAIKLKPDNAGAYYGLGSAYEKKRCFGAAIASYEKAIAICADIADFYYRLGFSLAEMGKLDAANASFLKAAEREPKFIKLYVFGYCVRVRAKGKPDTALTLLEKALELRPEYTEIHVGIGQALADKDELDRAITAYEKAIELQPDLAEAHVGLAEAYRKKGALDKASRASEKAITAFRKALELDPGNNFIRFRLACFLLKSDRVDEAIPILEKASSLDPRDVGAHTHLGIAYRSKGLLKEAIAAYEKAIYLNPTFTETYINYGLALLGAGRLDEAIAAFRKAIKLDPTIANIYGGLGNAYKLKGLLKEAIHAFNKAIELDPTFAEAYNNLGNVLTATGQLDKAIDAFTKAIELDPKLALAYFYLGSALGGKGQLDKAIDAFTKAIELKPNLPGSHHGLGLAYSIKGEHMKALHHIHRSQALDSKRKARGNPPIFPKSLLRQTRKSVLRRVLREGVVPENADECVPVASLLAKHEYHAHAARFWQDSLKEEPGRTEAISEDCWYLAAHSAALAGCGKGRDVKELDEAERASWRRQALAWFRKALAKRENTFKAGSLTSKALRKQLEQWLRDSDFAGLRDLDELKALPPEEHKACAAFWADVKALLNRLTD